MLAGTLLSYARAALAGSIKVDQADMPWYHEAWLGAGLTLVFVAAGWTYLRSLWCLGRSRWQPLLFGSVAIHLAAAGALPFTSNDLYSNLANGRLVDQGLNPYVNAPQDLPADDRLRQLVGARWQSVPTPYGPPLTAISALAATAGSAWAAIAVYKAIMLACVLGSVVIAYDFCQRYLLPQHGPAAFVLLAWNPLLAWEISGQAHNDGLMLLATCAFVWAAAAQAHVRACLALGLAFFSKFAMAPVLGLYLLWQARESLARAAWMAALVMVLGLVLAAPFWQGPQTLVAPLSAAGASPDRLANSFLLLICGGIALVAPALKPIVFKVWMFAARLGCGLLGVRFALRAQSLERVLADSTVFILVYECVAMGWYLPWYATWLLPLAMGSNSVRLGRIVAIFTSIVPALYLPADGLAVFLFVVPVVPLVLLVRRFDWLEPRPAV